MRNSSYIICCLLIRLYGNKSSNLSRKDGRYTSQINLLPVADSNIHMETRLKGSLFPSKNQNEIDTDLYFMIQKFVLTCFIQRNQDHGDLSDA